MVAQTPPIRPITVNNMVKIGRCILKRLSKYIPVKKLTTKKTNNINGISYTSYTYRFI